MGTFSSALGRDITCHKAVMRAPIGSYTLLSLYALSNVLPNVFTFTSYELNNTEKITDCYMHKCFIGIHKFKL